MNASPGPSRLVECAQAFLIDKDPAAAAERIERAWGVVNPGSTISPCQEQKKAYGLT
jgi:hypothetical protein